MGISQPSDLKLLVYRDAGQWDGNKISPLLICNTEANGATVQISRMGHNSGASQARSSFFLFESVQAPQVHEKSTRMLTRDLQARKERPSAHMQW